MHSNLTKIGTPGSKEGERAMEEMYARCCGIDVHKKKFTACYREGGKNEIREYETTSEGIRGFVGWLKERGAQISAMESTGVYWKSLYNIMEENGLEVIVVNAGHMKAVPGRKTDKNDAEWIAELLACGLLKASYIPDREQREMREITRYRKSLSEERARELNRLQKVLEGANIKLSCVVSDINGQSARRIIGALVGEKGNPKREEVVDLLDERMKPKADEIMKAIDGYVTPMQKQLIRAITAHIDDMSKRIKELDKLIDDEMNKHRNNTRRLDEIPGIGKRTAETILSEIGSDMQRFPTEAHLSSWSGLSPGNNESAGKRHSGKTNKGNRTLKTALIQAARAAVHGDNYFRAQYERLLVKRGKNRAVVAVAHSMLIVIYHMLKDGTRYQELGSDYYAKRDPRKEIARLQKKMDYLNTLIQTPV